MSYQSRFNFVGSPVLPKNKENSKRPFLREINKKDEKTKKNKKMLSMSFGVKESDNNMVFVEIFDGEQSVIKTFNEDNEKIEVNWEDRLDEDTISTVASYRKYIVDLGDEFGGRCEFITAYDMIEHLNKYLPKFDGRVVVTGQFVVEWYAKKKTYTKKFRVQNVFAAPDDRKNRLSLIADLYYKAGCLDESDYKETKKMTLDAYIEQYINKDEKKKYVPIQVVFSAEKYDFDNERHKKQFDYKMKYLKIKDKKMQHIPWEMVLIRGAEEAEFDESMLTDAQREQVELGIKTLDDFKPKGNIYGEKIDEIRLANPKLEGDYADGMIECEDTPDEFEEKIFVPAIDETEEEVRSAAKKKEKDSVPFDTEDNSDAVDDDDLF